MPVGSYVGAPPPFQALRDELDGTVPGAVRTRHQYTRWGLGLALRGLGGAGDGGVIFFALLGDVVGFCAGLIVSFSKEF